jgi:MYXO-CTERM domain-containing protein
LKPQPSSGPCYAGYSASSYQGQGLDDLPALDIAWHRDENGPGVVRFNKKGDIQRIVDRNNAAVMAYIDKEGDIHGGCGCHLGGRGAGGAAVVLAIALLGGRRRRRKP